MSENTKNKVTIAMERFFTLNPLIMEDPEVDYWLQAAEERFKTCDAIEETSIAINIFKITMALAERRLNQSHDIREFLYLALNDSGHFDLDHCIDRSRAA